MALEKIGSRLVAEGAAQYTRAMGQAAQATRGLRPAADEAGTGLSQLDTRSAALAVTIGNLASRGIMRLKASLIGLGRQAMASYGQFERMSLSMEALLAREIRTKDATLEMADALELAKPQARGLLNWIQKLAIESPFDMQGVAMAFKTAQAYNFTAAEAQKLTQVTIDFASATGATVGVMSQISLALGQIKAKGKLAGQEILQLVNAGINTNAILTKMGYTIDDVSKGLVSADEFMDAFTDTMEDEFGGAAKRMTETLTGLLNSLGDIKEITLREFFGPIFEAALPHITAMVEKFQELIPLIGYFGTQIGDMITSVLSNKEALMEMVLALGAVAAGFLLVTKAGTLMAIVPGIIGLISGALMFLLNPINILGLAVGALAALFVFSFTDIKGKTEGFFDNFGEDMFAWGRDIILALAEGMATAISYVLDVLISLGQSIAAWLMPGSPPKLLPKIDQWGASAFGQYLKGFAKADFGIFNQLGGTMESYIKSLGLKEAKIIPTIVGTKKALAAAIDELRRTGKVGERAFGKIFDAIGRTSKELKAYIKTYIEVQALTRKFDDALKPLHKELDAIEKRRNEVREGQRREELQKIVSDKGAPELAKELAALELKEMDIKNQVQDIEEAREKELDPMMAQLAAQEELVKAQIESNNLAEKQAATLERLAKAMEKAADAAKKGAKGKAGAPPGGGVKPPGGDVESVGEAISGAIAAWKTKIGELFGEVADKFKGVGDQLEELKKTWGTVFSEIIKHPAWQFVKTKLDEWGIGFGDILVALLGLMAGIAVFNVITTVVGKLAGVFTVLKVAVLGFLGLGALITSLFFVAAVAVYFAYKQYGSFVDIIWAAITAARQLVLGLIALNFYVINRAAKGAMFLVGILKLVPAVFIELGKIAVEFGEKLVKSFNKWQAEIERKVRAWIADQLKKFEDWKTEMGAKFEAWKEETKEHFRTAVEAVKELVRAAFAEILGIIAQWGLDFLKSIQGIWGTIQAAFEGAKTTLLGIVGSIAQGALDKFMEFDWFQVGVDIITGIRDGISSMSHIIGNKLESLARSAWKRVTDFFEELSPSKRAMRTGRLVGEGLARGFDMSQGRVQRAAYNMAVGANNAVSMPLTSQTFVTNNTYYNDIQTTGIESVTANQPVDLLGVELAVQSGIDNALGYV